MLTFSSGQSSNFSCPQTKTKPAKGKINLESTGIRARSSQLWRIWRQERRNKSRSCHPLCFFAGLLIRSLMIRSWWVLSGRLLVAKRGWSWFREARTASNCFCLSGLNLHRLVGRRSRIYWRKGYDLLTVVSIWVKKVMHILSIWKQHANSEHGPSPIERCLET